MIQFTAEEIKALRNRKERDEILSLLRSQAEKYLSYPLTIPETGCADWSHYYYCPDCSVMLDFDPLSPLDHVCPSCGRHFSDDKKNGAWWRLMNSFNENGANTLARIYLLSGDLEAAGHVRDILMGYARFYPDYVPHGDIPYNGPGKLNAQTLDEANFLRNLAYAYDVIEETLTPEEREYISVRMWKEGIAFLRANRHSQIHNHEVICNGAIGVLALILGDSEALSFALDGKYGLVYQLEHGTLEDGFWFECSTAYHFYAFQNFMLYEKFARHTPYSHLSNPVYEKMLLSILRIEREDGSFPLLNDCHPEQGDRDGYGLYEFAYRTWHSPELLRELQMKYRSGRRLSAESFFYGVPELPAGEGEDGKMGSLVGEDGLGASVIRRGPVYLLFRHGPYGGEHDHYDRLGLSYYYDGVPVSIDMGTTGYGAILHYDYYKNTATHNTVSINEGNQAPSRGHLISFSESSISTDAAAYTEWKDAYPMPDSFTIKEWDDESYKGVRMERRISVHDGFFTDFIRVSGASSDAAVLSSMHFHGMRTEHDAAIPVPGAFSDRKPLKHLDTVLKAEKSGVFHSAYLNDGVKTDVWSAVPEGEICLAYGPDNPSSRKMGYVLSRKKGEAVFMALIASGHESSSVSSASFVLKDGIWHAEAVMSDGRMEDIPLEG